MRFSIPLAVALAACSRAQVPLSGPERCGPEVPARAQHPIAVRPSDLAGEYELIQVQTQPSGASVRSGRLHLSPLDSSSKAASSGGAVRDLVGWLDLAYGEAVWQAAVASRDPSKPGVVLAGQHLRLGPAGSGISAHNLEITAVAAEGFWGWWRADKRLSVLESGGDRIVPDQAGYFCALRLDR